MPRTTDNPDLSVVVPVYRSGRTVLALVDRLLDVLKREEREFEIVLVDDGSPDETWESLREAQERDSARVSIARLSQNMGQHVALLCAMSISRGRLVVTIDDDLQHLPEDIPQLCRALEEENKDVVYGAYETRSDTIGRRVLSRSGALVAWLGFGFPVPPTPFRLLRRPVVEAILSRPCETTNVDIRVVRQTRRIGRAWITHAPSARPASTYTFRKLLGLSADVLRGLALRRLVVSLALAMFVATALSLWWRSVWPIVLIFGLAAVVGLLGRLFGRRIPPPPADWALCFAEVRLVRATAFSE